MEKIVLNITVIGIISLFILSGFNPLVARSEETIKDDSLTSAFIGLDSYGINTPIESTINFENSQFFGDQIYGSGKSEELEPKFASGQLIIKFKDDNLDIKTSSSGFVETGVPSIDLVNEKYSVKSLKSIPTGKENSRSNLLGLSGVYKMEFSEKEDINSVIKDYGKLSNVEYVEPNYIFHNCTLPNDSYFGWQWALNQANDHDIDAPEAWDIETGSSDVIIAVIDSGVDYTHPDLADNIWVNKDEIPGNGIDDDGNGFVDDVRGWDFVNNDNDPLDDFGHGTHCAGIAGAVTDNGVGIAGVCPNCKIMAVKSINSWGGGYETDLADGIIYAADNGADVISMSWGSYYFSNLLKDALDYAYEKGVILVAAAGNDAWNYGDASYPACLDNVIAVSATDESDYKAYFSNFGSWIDVAAPGVNIFSTMPTYPCTLTDMYGLSEDYDYLSGTSMACPHVAGLIGLLLSKNENYTQEEIRTILRSGVDNINVEKKLNEDKHIGTGRINAYKAMSYTSTAVVHIDNSLDDVILREKIIVKGTSNGNKFKSYTLYYGEDVYPNNWIEVITSTNPVNNDVLAIWDTHNLKDNLYTLKLVLTTNDNQQFIDMSTILLANAMVPGWPVEIYGEVSSSAVLYDLDHDNRDEIIFGSSDGMLYILRGDGTSYNSHWPLKITIPNSPYGDEVVGYSSPALGDIDGDGEVEIVVRGCTEIHVFNLDGTEAAGWPENFDGGYSGNLRWSSPVIADIDNDGHPNIIITTPHLRVYDYNGVLLWIGHGDACSTPAVGDLNGDGYLEIVSLKYQSVYLFDTGQIWVYNYKGEVLWISENIERPFMCYPVLGDIDRDGSLEIIIGGQGKIYAWHANGSTVSGWPKSTGNYNGSLSNFNDGIALGNIDNDDHLEIIVGNAWPSQGNVLFMFNDDGTYVNKTPVKNYRMSRVNSAPVIADINNDSKMEILMGLGFGPGSDEAMLGIWNDDGTVYDELGSLRIPHYIRSTPSIGDIDGDGKMEIVAGSLKIICAWELPGSYDKKVMEWPMLHHDRQHTGLYSIESNFKIYIKLLAGWNLITIPVQNNFYASTLAENITGCLMISYWNTTIQSYRSYVVGGPPSFDFPIENGIGYDILVENDTTFTVSGNLLTDASTALVQGYNLLGWYKSESTTASAIKKEYPKCFKIMGFDPITQTEKVYESLTDQDFYIGQGDGYFVVIDNIAPETKVIFNGKLGINGWYTNEVVVTLVASDDLSGISVTSYGINGCSFSEYSGPFKIKADGRYTIQYFSEDKAGNKEKLKSISLKIDKTVPTTTCTLFREPYSAKVTLSASDATSGVDKTYYSLDGAAFATYSAPLIIGRGTHTVSYYSVDYAGNTELKKFETITISVVIPVKRDPMFNR